MKTLYAIAICLLLTSMSFAEVWLPLDEYVSRCVLIVRAKAITDPDKNGMRTFEIIETWKGVFDPADFSAGIATENQVRARDDEHGVHVIRGQEIILFYSRHNQPDDKLHMHTTAFPIKNGTVIYAATNEQQREEMLVEMFKKRITAEEASTQPATGPSTRPVH